MKIGQNLVLGWFWVDLEAGIGISMKKTYQYMGSNHFFDDFRKTLVFINPNSFKKLVFKKNPKK